MLGLIWIQSVWHSDGIPKSIILKKLILRTTTKNNSNSKTSRRQKSIIKFPREGGGRGQIVNTISPVNFSEIKVSGLRNYTGCTEWYAHAFLRTLRHSFASSHYPFTVLVRRLNLN